MSQRPTLKKRWKRLRTATTGEMLGLVFRLWRRTLRVEVRGVEWLDGSSRSVIAIWHGRLHPCLLTVGRRGMSNMASRSRDGEVAKRIARHIGPDAVRGSSKRGGAAALAELAQRLEQGRSWSVALTVDGPRGPVAQPKRGAIDLARRLQIPILPTSASGRPCRTTRAWDASMIVMPFGRVLAQVGPPLMVDPDVSDDEVRAELKRRMDEMTVALDQELHGRSLWPHG
jgi:lysophospholipid acyltransferase (LPLAT)-like uncharacterized protein